MNQTIYKTDKELIIKIPLTQKRYNPYMGDGHVGEMANIIAVIDGHDMGFCYRIDMDYKGKSDQWSDFFFKWFNSQESFEQLCKELAVDLVYYN